ncbi:MAG: peptide-methionine (S)-S-oxide reductase MsrA [Spirochaetota bacterium]|nr:MAG: peptide-methionine (S)-S-oxide reductase MsrA [Spirochaetota bacterium]
MRKLYLPIIIAGLLLVSIAANGQSVDTYNDTVEGNNMGNKTELATFGGGCFWCTEAVYEKIDGVVSVISGYAGGNKTNPSYEDVVTGKTGHAEVIQIEFDPDKISYDELLDLFWKAHDPTTLNRQGADIGTQYRSIILYHNNMQREAAESSLKRASPLFDRPIVTEVKPLDKFYPAEDYHQDYYENNPNAGYCRIVISPKLKKLELE